MRQTRRVGLIKSIALLALLAILAGCEITDKTASPNPVAVGRPLTFTIDVAFDVGDQGALVVDQLPDSVQFVTASASGGGFCAFEPEPAGAPLIPSYVGCLIPAQVRSRST